MDAAQARDVLVEGGAWHWADSELAPPALVIGYGAVGEPEIRRGLGVLREVYGATAPLSRG